MPRNPIPVSRLAAAAVACLVIVAQSGCTSALTTTYLRDGLWPTSDHAAAPPPADDAESSDDAASEAESAPTPAADRERREAALEEAMDRLSRLGTIDAAVETALVTTLQRTQPEDWPVVVDEFAISLTASRSPGGPAGSPPAGAVESAAPATPPTPVTPDEPAPQAAAPGDAAPAAQAAAPQDPAPTETTSPAEPTATSAPVPTLAIGTACFASAVRAWGDVDRYPADRFRPGQEVIVYVELDHLSSRESPAGRTTCIDATLRLVDDADRTVHAWHFDPIAETATGQRRDNFARYVVRIPESAAPGGCRVEMAITDTLAGSTAEVALPVEIAAKE